MFLWSMCPLLERRNVVLYLSRVAIGIDLRIRNPNHPRWRHLHLQGQFRSCSLHLTHCFIGTPFGFLFPFGGVHAKRFFQELSRLSAGAAFEVHCVDLNAAIRQQGNIDGWFHAPMSWSFMPPLDIVFSITL